MATERFRLVTVLASAALVAGAGGAMGVGVAQAAPVRVASYADIVPAPVTAVPARGVMFTLARSGKIFTAPGSVDAAAVGGYLAAILRRSTGYALPVVDAPAGSPGKGVSLLLSGADPSVGAQGYQLDVTASAVVLRAAKPAGLFAGVQTLRQLLPPAVESATVQPGPWTVPGGHVVDHPRLAYRGAMLDVARHFFTV